MGTWSYPGTEENAEHLTRLMRDPIPRKFAQSWLEGLMGTEELFDKCLRYNKDEDIRPLLKDCLKNWLERLDRFPCPWEPKAIEMCKKLVAD